MSTLPKGLQKVANRKYYREVQEWKNRKLVPSMEHLFHGWTVQRLNMWAMQSGSTEVGMQQFLTKFHNKRL